ncbi:hypothetical protein BGZ98_007691 [Dissophora globulifera]|nr:hypothetical protein BGZ98_007691 [Dissophora globulifera]
MRAKELSKKTGQLPEADNPQRPPAWSIIEYFVRLNGCTGGKWSIAPLSLVEEGLHGTEKRKAGVATVIKMLEPDAIRDHINVLRQPDFYPREYTSKGYILPGSIKTDGYKLQARAFKVRELLSLRFERARYRPEALPDRLIATIAGTGDPSTEMRDAFKSKENVERRLRCTVDQVDKVSYLGIDLSQTCVVGAYALLPLDKKPRIGGRSHNRHRGRESNGHRNKRARAFGYIDEDINEFYTPKKRPICYEFVCQTKSLRRHYCFKCWKYRHRDVLEGHDICNILKSRVEQQERPLFLQPMKGDGSYVWVEKDGKNKDQQATSASPPPNQAAPMSSCKRHMEGDGYKKADPKGR